MKIRELRSKSESELKELLVSERQKILELAMRGGESKPKNVKEARETRKIIARIITILKK